MSNLIIALDFDGTLCCDNLFPVIGTPRTWLIDKAIEWRKRGHKVILWTCRENILPTDYSPYWDVGDYLTEAVEWCKARGLEFDAINMNLSELNDPHAKVSRKIFAHYYIDDKSIILDDVSENILGMDKEIFNF
jgi:hypothetical protein